MTSVVRTAVTGPLTTDRRRPEFDRRSDALSVLAMVDYLRSQPSIDQIAEYLVLLLMPSRGVTAAAICLIESDSRMRIVGSFGMSESMIEPLSRLALIDQAPMCEALRSGEPVIIGTAQEVMTRFPWTSSNPELCVPTAAWPLSIPSRRVGAIQLFFGNPADHAVMSESLEGLTGLLSLMLSGLSWSGLFHNREQVQQTGHGRDGASDPGNHSGYSGVGFSQRRANGKDAVDELSARQFRVLQMMAEGLTNAQIARRIGFSESTVRQETMAVFRFLQVHNRHEAVRVAGPKGLLTAPAEQTVAHD